MNGVKLVTLQELVPGYTTIKRPATFLVESRKFTWKSKETLLMAAVAGSLVTGTAICVSAFMTNQFWMLLLALFFLAVAIIVGCIEFDQPRRIRVATEGNYHIRILQQHMDNELYSAAVECYFHEYFTMGDRVNPIWRGKFLALNEELHKIADLEFENKRRALPTPNYVEKLKEHRKALEELSKF